MPDRNKALELVRKMIVEGENPTKDAASDVWDATALRNWYAECKRLSGYLEKDSPFKKDLTSGPTKNNLWDEDVHSTMLACLKQIKEELEAPIDLNSASAATLRSLPGVARVIADRIKQAGPYHSVDDLTRVDGIGESRLAAIRPHVTCDG